MDLENETICAEADDAWCQDGIWIAVYNEPITKGYVRLPDVLVDAWDSREEIGEALELPFPLAYGPHPAMAGIPEPERRWIGVDAFEYQVHTRNDHPAVVINRIHAQLMVLVTRLLTAEEFAKQGLSVKPASLTYTHEDILKLAMPTGENQSRAEVVLGPDESSWYPDMGYYSFRRGTIVYEFDQGKVRAHRA